MNEEELKERIKIIEKHLKAMQEGNEESEDIDIMLEGYSEEYAEGYKDALEVVLDNLQDEKKWI